MKRPGVSVRPAAAAVLLVFLCVSARAVHAQPPSPIEASQFAFPGVGTAPGSGRSAAVARADRWVGREPFDNPAIPGQDALVLTPTLQHVSRQDLRADNRSYSETSGFFDVLGGWAAHVSGDFAIAAYAHQPLVRHEAFAYTRGVNLVPPALLAGKADMREWRAGVAVSHAYGALRVGLAGEYTGRNDTYETNETSGSPEAGLSHVDFSGGAVGAQTGVRWSGRSPWGGPLVVGGAARWIPTLKVDVNQQLMLALGDSTRAFSAERKSGWEGGVSADIAAGPTTHVFVSAGGRTAQDWDGFDVTDGRQAEWRIGAEFHDPRDPWTLRFGIGQDQQSGVPESHAGVLGLGIGWDFDGTVLDFGVLRRTLQRPEHPTSYEDRLVVSVVLGL